jgi:hypothetical protein
MAKPDYPGLVLVPPSDRSILKRRLAKWAFLIISLIGGLSSLNIWFPSPHRTRDCQQGTDVGSAYALRPDCTQTAQAFVEAPSPQPEVAMTPQATTDASKRVILDKSRAAKPVIATPSPKRPKEQPLAQHKTTQTTNTSSVNTGNSASTRMVATSQANESSASLIALQHGASQPSAQHKTAKVSNASPANPWNEAYSRMVGSLPTNDSTASLIDPPPVTSHTPTDANPDVLLAERGDAFAQYRLGRFYAQQSGVRSPEAASWYMKASDGLRQLASTGNGKAMYVLGVMYAFGRGVVQNKDEARNWLAQAVAHQVPAAGPVLASLDKNRPADSNPAMSVQAKRRQT